MRPLYGTPLPAAARGADDLSPRDPDRTREGIFVYHNCSRCRNGSRLDRCPTPERPGNCGHPIARND